jgi:hypothetical protein
VCILMLTGQVLCDCSCKHFKLSSACTQVHSRSMALMHVLQDIGKHAVRMPADNTCMHACRYACASMMTAELNIRNSGDIIQAHAHVNCTPYVIRPTTHQHMHVNKYIHIHTRGSLWTARSLQARAHSFRAQIPVCIMVVLKKKL